MKRSFPPVRHLLGLLALTLVLPGCELVGDILEFGFWVGAIVVVAIVALIWWIAQRLGGRRRGPPPSAP